MSTTPLLDRLARAREAHERMLNVFLYHPRKKRCLYCGQDHVWLVA